ncbi:hypothetical protein [Constantimarinum furrinae]|uniref:Uncharacterized protein n=1 Tax=Constantimarinum furrinae TaxID=2562285 RepID=A0A7G8PR07_9FLAO|nr:hypothetical protein [Constantimarinum furrinae]QNJ96773.1 hypothetical protein ALE3EI_0183 [Constantimarinum furrinae]
MKLISKVFYLLLGILLLNSCCSNCPPKCEECPQTECTDRKPSVEDEFFLSIRMDESAPYSDKFQTIFVESPMDETGDVFVIGSKIKGIKDVQTNVYKDVGFKDITLRRLAGQTYGITNIELIDDHPNYRYVLKVSIDSIANTPENDQVKYSQNIIIPEITPNDKLEVQVTNLHKPSLRTKICQIQAGS